MKKIAIVGADASKWGSVGEVSGSNFIINVTKQLIEQTLSKPGVVLVSGACPYGGVDIWAEEIADKLGVKKIIFKPVVNRWSDGYRPRNIKIANECDVLYCFEPTRVGHSGGLWTLRYAKGLGKPVREIYIDEILKKGRN